MAVVSREEFSPPVRSTKAVVFVVTDLTKDRAENKCLTPIVRSTRRAGSRQLASDTFFPLIAKLGSGVNVAE